MHLYSVHGEIGFVLSGRIVLHVVWEQHACTGKPVAPAEKVFVFPGSAAPTKAVGQDNAMKTIQAIGRKWQNSEGNNKTYYM